MKTPRTYLAWSLGLGLMAGVGAVQAQVKSIPVAPVHGAAVDVQAQPRSAVPSPLEDRLAALERQAQNQGVLALHNQISELKTEIAKLRGRQEELQHQLQLAEQRTKELFSDLDDRLKELSKTVSSPPAVVSPVQPSAPVPQGGSLLSQGQAPSSEQEAKAYEEALILFRESNFQAAAQAFQRYAESFPGGALAANAVYWLGLSRFSLKDYPAAIAAHEQLLAQFPTSAKVPDAMVNMARARIQMGDMDAASALLERVIGEFPFSKAAEIARTMQSLAK